MEIDTSASTVMASSKEKESTCGTIVPFTWATSTQDSGKALASGNQAHKTTKFTSANSLETKSKAQASTFGAIAASTRAISSMTSSTFSTI